MARQGILERCPRLVLHLWLPLLVCAIVPVGCQKTSLRDRYTFYSPQIRHVTLMPTDEVVCASLGNLNQASACFAAGVRQEEEGLEGCVDLYYLAAIYAWRHLESAPVALPNDSNYQTAWQTYQRSLGGLMTNAIRFGRLDPRGHLIVADSSRRRTVPIEYYGFAWKPNEFCQLHLTSDFAYNDLQNNFQSSGLGISLVAVRQGNGQEMFYRPKQPFPVTAVLRSRGCEERGTGGGDAVLAFYNPCLYDSLHVGSAVAGLAKDLSAPFACLLRESPRNFTEGFVNPSDGKLKPKLIMMEPYQRGKIPVVLIHGLWSDSMTWADTANELRAQGDLYRRYQFWYFEYPTGGELLISTAELREKLLLAREQFDPKHQDAAMEQIVLIGHSMGGLVAQFEATYSYDVLWQHIANQPLEAVRTSPAMREELRRTFFFDPSPLVKRVIFIGTPHKGSGMSGRLAGRAASSLVRFSSFETTQYRRLMDDNQDIFKEYLWKERPTTVDLLEPSNPMLLALAKMPFGCGIRWHSIIGTGKSTLAGETSDGVVPISSARQAGACSELLIPAGHQKLHRNPACVAELMRILRLHDRQ